MSSNFKGFMLLLVLNLWSLISNNRHSKTTFYPIYKEMLCNNDVNKIFFLETSIPNYQFPINRYSLCFFKLKHISYLRVFFWFSSFIIYSTAATDTINSWEFEHDFNRQWLEHFVYWFTLNKHCVIIPFILLCSSSSIKTWIRLSLPRKYWSNYYNKIKVRTCYRD